MQPLKTSTIPPARNTPRSGCLARAPQLMLPIFRLPLPLYRLGLGSLLGHRFMLLTHTGRRTGKVHRTVLAVLHFDPVTHEVKVMSAWGRSDWVKNSLRGVCGTAAYPAGCCVPTANQRLARAAFPGAPSAL